ncbi:MAG: hypothetical protein IJ406_07325 [Oscillospiraceae bacterium]|nr:hypothetical protein [Oscillospiraceae bacterium]
MEIVAIENLEILFLVLMVLSIIVLILLVAFFVYIIKLLDKPKKVSEQKKKALEEINEYWKRELFQDDLRKYKELISILSECKRKNGHVRLEISDFERPIFRFKDDDADCFVRSKKYRETSPYFYLHFDNLEINPADKEIFDNYLDYLSDEKTLKEKFEPFLKNHFGCSYEKFEETYSVSLFASDSEVVVNKLLDVKLNCDFFLGFLDFPLCFSDYQKKLLHDCILKTLQSFMEEK